MKAAVSLILFFILISTGYPQHENILITSKNYPEEPTLCINPYNPNIIVGGANLNNYFYSADGGRTWKNGTLTSTLGVAGDPCVIMDKEENFYFFHLSNPSSGQWLDRIVSQKSTDFGKTWNNGSYMGLNSPKDQDKEWATVDFSRNTIYVTWTQFDEYGSNLPYDKSNILFSKSTNGAQTWTEPLQINQISGNCIDGDQTTEGAVPAVGPNGEVYVAWAYDEKIYFDKSDNYGQTWLDEDVLVANQPGGWAYDVPGISRCNGLPVTCCDTSPSDYNGNIYINWTDQRNGLHDTDVWFVKSQDKGETWSAPTRVNDDSTQSHQFFTWMTIDQANGKIYIVFYDRRNYTDNMTDVYMAMSEDGGETFINFRISESPFEPKSTVFFGDYTNITAHNDVVRPIWTRLHYGFNENGLSIYTSIIDLNKVGIDAPQSYTIAEHFSYPNPVDLVNYFSFKLKQQATVSLTLLDAQGRIIKPLINHESMPAGKYTERISFQNLALSPGVYFYSFSCNNKHSTQKVIFLE